MGVMDRFRLDGKTALVTGGSRGLGRQMAQALAEAGADLILIGREQSSLERAATELEPLGTRVSFEVGDVGLPDVAKLLAEKLLAAGTVVDVLINNVGGRRSDTATEEYTIDEWQRLFDLNLTSALAMTQVIGKSMIARRSGSIINITSVAGPIAIKGIRGRHYECAKSALTALTKSLAADWACHGVRVNAIAPGVFLTDPNRRWFGEKPDFQSQFLDHIPMGRLGEPAELGPAALFLASEASSYMTGATVTIDGGFTLW